MSRFQFSNYDIDELHGCGKAFKAEFSAVRVRGNREWTTDVHKWFVHSCAEGVRPFCHSHSGEFLVDLCHLKFPIAKSEQEQSYDRWLKALETDKSCSMLLAVESEWGKQGDWKWNTVLVLDDAHKLAVLRSKVKVMIYSSNPGKPDQEGIPESIKKLRQVAGDSDPWLCIDVPYTSDIHPFRIAFEVLK